MASFLDALQQPFLSEDMFNNDPRSIYASMGVPQEEIPQDPRSLSGRIQEVLGAKKPNEQGRVGEILSQRFKPSLDDVSKGVLSTLVGGKPVSGEDVATDRAGDLAKTEYLMGRATGTGGGSSVYAQRMAALNEDPTTAKLPIGIKMQIASGKVGTNLQFGEDGTITDMAGAAQGLGNLSYGEEMGTQNARINTARPLAVQKGLGEADTAAGVASQTAIGRATGEAQGAIQKKVINAPQMMTLVQQARGILPYATNGGFQSKVAGYKGYYGISDAATQADAQLDTISAGLLNNVPRMEGPQSDADRISYEKAAGDIGNRAKPIGDRIAALAEIERIQNQYMNNDQGSTGGIKFLGFE